MNAAFADAPPRGPQLRAAAALLVKVFTGSSIAAGAAEKAAAKVFGQWLPDTPDARLRQAGRRSQRLTDQGFD
jgi:hypothetical protein